MDSTQEDNYLQKITELLYDDNEIVTSTILGNILNIKVDYAQTLLEKYVQNADVPDQTDVSWTYLIIGRNEDDNISVLLSKYKEVVEKKKVLKIIISQQIYSVQRNPDIDLIALANAEPITENSIKNKLLLGSVVSKNSIKRKLKVTPKAINETKSEISESSKQNGIFESTNKVKKNSIEHFCTKGNPQNNFKSTSSVKSKQKNVMANFFSRQSNKPESTNGNISSPKQAPKIEHDNEDLVKDTSANIEQKDNSSSISSINIDDEGMEVDTESERKEKEIAETKKDESRNKQTTSKQKKKSKKRHTEGKSDQPSKKRKRIVEANDSDSDIFASSESEIEVVPDINISDYEEEGKIVTTLPAKARQMKQITEEFMDEDGYINTVQKYIMVSDDEADENKEQKPMNTLTEKITTELGSTKNKDITPQMKKEVSPKKPMKGNKSKASKGNQNQPSIMNFFKKA